MGRATDRRRWQRACAFGALIAAVAATAPVANTPTAEAAAPTVDLLVGDSVMAGMSLSSRASLPSHVFDAKVCRRLVATSCSYRGVRPATALQVVQGAAGATNRAIVVAAGYNDGSIGTAIDRVVAEARRQGVPHVVWLTYRVAGNNASIYRSHNATLWAKAAAIPELTVADWASLSAGRGDWVAPDGLHLNGSGARAMANLISSTLAALPPLGPPPVAPGASVCFTVGGGTGDAALLNITPLGARSSGHGVVTPSEAAPAAAASNVNFAHGTVDPNVAVAHIGSAGRACFHNSDHTGVHVVVDHLATLDSGAFVPARADGLPARRLDTRHSAGTVAAGGRTCFGVSGQPGDGAVINLTPVRATAAGHGVLTSSPDSPPDDASNVNYTPWSVDPNVAIAPISPNGTVCFHASAHGSVDLVADQLGTISSDSFEPATVDGVPSRLLDTRLGDRPVAPGTRRCFATGAAPGDIAVVNLTPVRASAAGHGLLVSSDLDVAADSSNVNYRPWSTDPNVATARVGSDGNVCFVTSTHASVHVVADLLGTLDADAITLPTADGRPSRRLDTRVD